MITLAFGSGRLWKTRMVVGPLRRRCLTQSVKPMGRTCAPGQLINAGLDRTPTLSDARVHRTMLDSGSDDSPAGQTSCGLLLGSSNGLLKYELSFRMRDIGQRRICSHWFSFVSLGKLNMWQPRLHILHYIYIYIYIQLPRIATQNQVGTSLPCFLFFLVKSCYGTSSIGFGSRRQ